MRRLTLALVLACSPLVTASADDPVENQQTCHDVAQALLRPRVAAVEAAESGLAEYDLRNGLWGQEQRRLRDAYAQTEHIAKAALGEQRAELEGQRARVAATALAAEAVERARASELRKAAAERRAAGAVEQADDLERQAVAIDEVLAARGLRFELEGQSGSRTLQAWESWLGEREKAVAKTAASVEAGSYRVVNPELGDKRLTWSGAQGHIASLEKNLAAVEAGTVRWYLDAVDSKYDRAGIEGRLEQALAKLLEDRTAIREGSYPVSTDLGFKADRNYVENMIAEAEFAILDKRNKWSAKVYVHVHPNGTRPSNGSIEGEIEAARKVIKDKLAEGDHAVFRLNEWGGDDSAASLKRKLKEAEKRGDKQAVATYQELLSQWSEARAAWLEVEREVVQRHVDRLELHRELFEEDLRTDREHIDGYLKRILDQTPCGGSAIVDPDPKLVKVREHHDHLRASSETDLERYRRLEDYDDRVYVGRDGRVHGDLRDGLAHALRDTGVRKPVHEQRADTLLEVQGLLGQLAAFKDLGFWTRDWAAAHALIDEFVAAIGALDPSSKHFFRDRKALRATYLAKIEELLSKGVLFEGRIDDLIAAVTAAGGESARTREMLETLQRLKVRTLGLGKETLPRLWDALRSMEGLSGEAAAQWQRLQEAWAQGPVAGSGGAFAFAPPNWGSMSTFERGMFSLSLAGAVAQTIQRTSQGMATEEALFRSSVDLLIDVAVGGVPVLAAADVSATALFTLWEQATGEVGTSEANLSGYAKERIQAAFDKIAEGAASVGHGFALYERELAGEPGLLDVLSGVDRTKLERAVAQVETQLDALEPGHPDEERFLRMRGTLRQLLRAKGEAGR